MKNKNYKKGMEGEKRAQKKYGGYQTLASGALWFSKEDVRVEIKIKSFDGILIQNKTTGKKSYILKEKDLYNLTMSAIEDDMIPAFRIEFEGKDTYMIVPEYVFEELIDGREEKEEGSNKKENREKGE